MRKLQFKIALVQFVGHSLKQSLVEKFSSWYRGEMMSMKANVTLFVSISFLLMSSANVFAQCVVPNDLTNGQVADANQVMGNFDAIAGCADNAAPAGSQNAVQYNAGSGAFGAVGPLGSGQLIIGATGNAPQAGTLTAGSGIAILNSPGGITIAATGGGGGGGGVDWLNAAAVVTPVVANFTLQTSTSAPAGAALTGTTRGMVLTTSASTASTAMMAEMSAPAGNWQATMLAVYTGPVTSFNLAGIAIRDAIANRAVMFGLGGAGGTSYRFDYEQFSGGIGLDTYNTDSAVTDAGLPAPFSPVWSRLTYDGTNFIWSFSRDGQHFVSAYSISATAYIANRSTIGPVLTYQQVAKPTWSSAYHILSWSVEAI
ncbi:hypothetical protein NFO65_12740 [Neorhizobium galegae]|uniref:hypothetical protein n=1 Tax=Neorhizobium galegae TaxID=399 RepID=UPI002101A7F8|nr:hypothetical protein [Neorhizobium galegae]MCQ1571603.1 hypothetical protein [Neorhizobium galegae]MCQ1837772.1 hypothetical protein [Neorhizobium galegae]UIY31515.1 hypothetical protein LZK73_31180 [Neorhizobium galegae]